MAADDQDRDLDFLLAQGRLPGPVKERIKDQLLASVRAEEQPARRRVGLWAGWAAGAATALALGAFLLLPRLRPDDGFSAKSAGGGSPLEVQCLGASPAACPLGSTLLFVVGGSARAGYLTAFAEPDGGGERIWYFSAQDEAPAVAADRTVPLRKGIVLGTEHRPGHYQLRLLLTDAPLARADALAGRPPGLIAESSLPLQVVPR
jgi:hypothetical protein